MRKLLFLLSLSLSMIPGSSSSDDFVPKDIARSMALGCSVSGITDSPPYAEVQVFAKLTKDSPTWDYRPVVARYTVEQGGAVKAIDECVKWWQEVKKKFVDAKGAK
jgi:hypothetical protein